VADPIGARPAGVVPAADKPTRVLGLPEMVREDSPSWVRNFAIEYVEAA
jgi:hypothetical protein